jgi:succinate dehydrogenase / fumarate reductase cytochrome b subunit
MSNFFSSSIGKKLIMSLAGLFLIIFLIVHLGINISLILCKSREYFNIAAHFMSSNIIIKIFEIILFGGFILHMFYGVILQIQNWLARPKRYRIENYSQTSFFSKFMIHTSIIITIFLVLHLLDFYIKSEFTDSVEEVIYNGKEYKDLGLLVVQRFKIGWVVIVYVAALLFLGFHLHHAFQSAFQTLGLNHKTYTPIIKTLGVIYSIVITGGFMSIPLVIYFLK